MDSIPNENMAVMFGGAVVDDAGVHCTTNIYYVTFNEKNVVRIKHSLIELATVFSTSINCTEQYFLYI